jgi:membrane-associated phospholipid phosphatase
MSATGRQRVALRRLTVGVVSRLWWLPLTATGLLTDRGSRGRWFFSPGIVVLTALASTAGKLVIRRPRPGAHSRVAPIGRSSAASFPSTHSACAFAIAAWMQRSRQCVWLHLLAAGLGYSRVRGRVHYPSDVVAGGVLGYAIGRWVDWIWSVLVEAIELLRYGSSRTAVLARGDAE